MPDFTVCVLLYGDYPHLAQRVLPNLEPYLGQFDLRIGLNDVSDRTRRFVNAWGEHNAATVSTLLFESGHCTVKYPLMRSMFLQDPIKTRNVMWFDDDSYIRPGSPANFFHHMGDELKKHAAVGSKYKIKLGTKQKNWVQDQDWYKGKSLDNVSFLTGGWWCLRTDIIQKYSWPLPELYHRGGDVMLGVLLNQQGLTMGQHKEWVAINADGEGKESKAVRRGFDEKPIGADYDGKPLPTHTLYDCSISKPSTEAVPVQKPATKRPEWQELLK